MVCVNDIAKTLETLYPLDTAEKWDNCGLITGVAAAPVKTVCLSLDASAEAVSYATRTGAQMLVTHHPLIFEPLKRITARDMLGTKIFAAIKNNIAIYAAHTNFDTAAGGVCDCLFDTLGLINRETLFCGSVPFGRAGNLPKPFTLSGFAHFAIETLKTSGVSFVGSSGAPIVKLGLCGGSGASHEYQNAAKSAGCDTYLTSDATYHKGQYAFETGLNLINVPHFAAERPAVYALRAVLTDIFQDVAFSVFAGERDFFEYI